MNFGHSIADNISINEQNKKEIKMKKMKKIIAIWVECNPKTGYKYELRVVASDHYRFTKGTRFDFGFLQVANSEGYIVEIMAGALAKSSI